MYAAKSRHSWDSHNVTETHVDGGVNDRSHDAPPVYTAVLHYITFTVLAAHSSDDLYFTVVTTVHVKTFYCVFLFLPVAFFKRF